MTQLALTIDCLRELNMASVFLRMTLAVICGGMIGLEREQRRQPAGFRTYILICLGSATAMMLGEYDALMLVSGWGESAAQPNTDVCRFGAQVINGIGFLGAGTIFISQKKIAGLTTAASLWNAACLGLAIGMGYYFIAIVGCGLVMVTLVLLQRVVKVNSVKHVEVKFIHRVETIAFINDYFQSIGVRVLDIDFHVENKGKYNLYTNIYTLDMQGKATYKDIVNKLSEHTNIQGIRTRNT